MAYPRWRSGLFPFPQDPRLVSWLIEPGSLTARCVAASRQFRVQLLRQGRGQPLPDEAEVFRLRPGQSARVREVLLECDGVPVIYAHTVLPSASRGRLARWLAGLGSRSLGSLLFTHPGFGRGPIEFRRLDRRHPLFARAARALSAELVTHLWARRSAHRLDGQTVLVTEVFLPAILRLEA
ncbi:MAG TPA: chorismate lyase [Rhodocyclaceae bacterium]|nr:chorismate lyase [Rhodocyclaceae bacterium]